MPAKGFFSDGNSSGLDICLLPLIGLASSYEKSTMLISLPRALFSKNFVPFIIFNILIHIWFGTASGLDKQAVRRLVFIQRGSVGAHRLRDRVSPPCFRSDPPRVNFNGILNLIVQIPQAQSSGPS